MYVIPLCPLSQNQAWKGKRYKSSDYKQYEKDVTTYLLTLDLPKVKQKEKIYLLFEFGTVSRQDLSNNLKLLEDIICRYLGIDDRYTMAIFCRKVITKKVDSFIKFNIFLTEHELLEAIMTEA